MCCLAGSVPSLTKTDTLLRYLPKTSKLLSPRSREEKDEDRGIKIYFLERKVRRDPASKVDPLRNEL